VTTTVLARDTARIPVLPVAVKRAVDDWLARGYAVEICADGTLRVTPPTPQDDLDMIDFTRRRR
jgi:nicotinamidase-related amidase